ncbi:MAG: general stress protein [Steroidobacteraceae bacterium]|jgi:hypothetical protein|nr:general stress protein [Steroidobacteraceae bacterium]
MSIDLPIVRVYENAEAAERAIRSLRRWGFEEERISLIARKPSDSPVPGTAMGLSDAGGGPRGPDPLPVAGRPEGPEGGLDAERWIAELRRASIPRSQWASCLAAVQRGQVLLSLRAPFGTGGIAEDMLDEAGPVPHAIEPYRRPLLPSHWAAPFSRILGLPVLIRPGRTTSDALGLPTVTRPGRTTSEAIGMPTLVRRRRFMLGEPRLHDTAAPFSRAFGLPVLTRRGRTVGEALGLPELARSRRFVFGPPRLFDAPAPFSSMLALPVLVRRDRRGGLRGARPDEHERRLATTPDLPRDRAVPPQAVPRPRREVVEDVADAR